MTFSLDEFFRDSGTRFLLHPQAPFLQDYHEPETVWVSSAAGSLLPGPADRRMYTILPSVKKPYGEGDGSTPPFEGTVLSPPRPDPGGHFDHIKQDTPQFLAAHLFGSIRRVLDIWEVYSGGPVPWHFQAHHPRLEIVARLPWKNAQFGWGFCECGEDLDDQGRMRPFALNFDVVAHEVGHGLVFAMTGIPGPEDLTSDYRGFHESASDLVAYISSMHFSTMLRRILEQTEGDLYVVNELNRIGELSRTRQIRKASNETRLEALTFRSKKPGDLTGHEVHELGQPMTGAFFDISVEFFLHRLVRKGLLKKHDLSRMRRIELGEELDEVNRECCKMAYRKDPEAFLAALADARDLLGVRLARTWHRVRPAGLTFEDVARTFMAIDHGMTGALFQESIKGCFEWRGIKVT